jgi:uncharacterized protein YuzE
MRLFYYPETDSLYIELREHASVDSLEVAPGVVVDLDAQGGVVGIDIDHARERLSSERLEIHNLTWQRICGRRAAVVEVGRAAARGRAGVSCCPPPRKACKSIMDTIF